MATVTVTGLLRDETGRKDSRDWKAFSPVYREGSSGEVVTMRAQPVRVVAGVFKAELEPGVCVLENPDGRRYTVTVPGTDADLWDLIAVAVAVPPETAADALDDAVQRFITNNPDYSLSGTARRPVQLANNCFATGYNDPTPVAVSTAGSYEMQYTVGNDGANVVLIFGNWHSSPSADIDSDVSPTFSAAFRDASGALVACTFQGKKTVTLSGGGSIPTDPLPVGVKEGDVVYVVVYLQSGSAYSNRSTLGGGFTAATDLTASGSARPATANVPAWGPIAIVGTPVGKPKALAVQGDSSTFGYDDARYSRQNAGFIDEAHTNVAGNGHYMRALTGSAGVIIQSVGASKVSDWMTTAGSIRRETVTQFATHAIIGGGLVDLLFASSDLDTVHANLLAQAKRNLAHGVKNIIPTLTPCTTTTDHYLTLANQTVYPFETDRVAHNTWVRAGCPMVNGIAVEPNTPRALVAGQPGHPIAHWLEIADLVESQRNSGKWKAADRQTADAAMALNSTTVTSATANFTNADIGKGALVESARYAGAPEYDLLTTIVSINSPTSAELAHPAAVAVTGKHLTIGNWTSDGLHSTSQANKFVAAAVQVPLLALLS